MSGSGRDAQPSLRRLHHELRTPLGQIIGYGEMVEEEVRDHGLTDVAEDLQKIQEAARDLLRIVGEIFADGATEAPVATASADGARILVVDDEENNRDLLARRLERRGYTVETAADGRAALHAVESSHFDLVLLDVMMPQMGGIEVLRALRGAHTATELPVIMASALDARDDVVAALEAGANDYVTKPLDFPIVLARVQSALALRRAAADVESLAQQLAFRNAAIRRVFGRYVSDEVVDAVLENPEGLELRGESRRLTILLCDLRGFSSLVRDLAPHEIVAILNTFLGTMSEVIQRHHGTIDEFFGDAILSFFGAPISREDDCHRAAACALEMQRAMESVNRSNRSRGLPEIEMGIGIATGEVVVGNIGSEKRAKYGAVGGAVNLVSRIESYTLGGEIWISAETYDAIDDHAVVGARRHVHPKGLDAPIEIYRLVGLGGDYDLHLPSESAELVELLEEVPVRFAVLDGKSVGLEIREARLWALSAHAAKLRSPHPVAEMSDMRIEFHADDAPGSSYAKVVSASEDSGELVVRFTNRSADFAARLAELLGRC